MRRFWIGIDVSKRKLDVTLLGMTGQLLAQRKISNDREALIKLAAQWCDDHRFERQEVLVCIEPTGHYSYKVLFALMELGLPTWQAHPLDIKKSIGSTRGKSDKLDAYRIAQYAFRFNDRARLITQDYIHTLKLKQLINRRESLVKRKKVHQNNLKELNTYLEPSFREECDRIDQEQLALLSAQLKQVEQLIKKMIAADEKWNAQNELLLTIDGVGPVVAAHLISITDGFTRFKTARELACHAGFAPFPYTSGSSIRGRSRVSKQSHKGLKTVVHMGAKSVIQRKCDLQEYYLRKVGEGKKKMKVLNAVANKIIHRVCAVIERGTPYVGYKTSKAV